MIHNYLKIAWRNLLRHKTFSFINIFGLAGGLAACMLLFLYVQYETGYDRQHQQIDRIARVITTLQAPEATMDFGTTPAPLADALQRDFPDIAATARLQPNASVISYQKQLFSEDHFFNTDAGIFKVFTYEFLAGTPEAALRQPNSLVLTASHAKKYFGNVKAAMGQTLKCNKQNVQVTAVIADPPRNSDIHFTGLLSKDFSTSKTWLDGLGLYTFLLFKGDMNIPQLERKMKPLADKYAEVELDGNNHLHYQLEAMRDVHFSKGKLIDTPKGNRQFNYMFSLLALFILIIALLNYINLTTVRATDRAKEVGVRKVNGARRFELIRQFLLESLLLISIAWAIALGVVAGALPYFNRLLDTDLRIALNSSNLLFLAGIFVATILLAGLYPAFVQAGFKPITVLKGKFRNSFQGIMLRKVLTTAQFVITAALITGTLVIYSQMQFLDRTDPGYAREQVIEIDIPTDEEGQRSLESFVTGLQQQSVVQQYSVGASVNVEDLTAGTTFAYSGNNRREMMCNYFYIDKHFVPLLQIPMLEGRNFSDSLVTDKQSGFIVNEAFVKSMGWKQGVGQTIEGFDRKGPIVGVVRDFHYKSMHNAVEPLVMIYYRQPVQTVIAKVKPRDIPTVAGLWKQHYPDTIFDYAFLDENYREQYDKDRVTMQLFSFFTILAIAISCLGLYGLVSLIAIQRTKEIGIRKVLGATLQQLISLLTKDFVRLILLASLIGLPLAGIAMQEWLTNYAYHISLTWWMFLLPVLFVLATALVVIARQVIRAALANPVTALRNE